MIRTNDRSRRHTRPRLRWRYALVLALVVIGLLFGVAALTAAQVGAATAVADATDSSVDVTILESQSVQAGTTTNATVVAEGAENGISTYEVTVTSSDASVATLDDVEVHAGDGDNAPLTEVERADDGSELTVTVALLDATHEPADEIELFDVAVAGQAVGEADLDVVAVRELTDLDVDEYDVGHRGGAAVTVTDLEGAFAVTGPEQIDEGQDVNATVSMTGADGGLSAYEFTLAANESDVVTLHNVSVHAEGADGPMVATDVSENGSTMTVTVALLDAVHEPAAEIDLLDVTLTGQTEGTVELAVTDVGDVASLDHRQYVVENADGLVVDVAGAPGGGFLPPPAPEDASESEGEGDDPAAFELGAIDVPDEVVAGENVSVGVPVENVGGDAGTVTGSVSLDGTVYETAAVEIDGGSTDVVAVDVTAPATPDEYELVVQIADDESVTTLTVVEAEVDDSADDGESTDASTDSPTDDESGSESGDDDMAGFGIIAALGAILAIGLSLRQRRGA
ncbi:hypothetical protein OB955_10635 [Halobacteria archaeon AArc-m2/3/4]|uniref:CARDB domain-containing protein n=1 Tax=Natronoglomus mannanivorans TaxID=2979990 RepID=A0ABT2QE43_9EURY|nr:hypothetical protein [Halobacteria archaeon AArc-m2/3/4]